MYNPFNNKCKFEIGDIVNLCTGYAPQRVIDIRECGKELSRSGWLIKAEYTRYSSNTYEKNIRWRSDLDYDFYQSEPKKEIEMTKRYKTPEGYEVIFVGTTTSGQWVVEANNGAIAVYKIDDLTEIKPYGISVTSFNNNGHIYKYLTEEGKFALGDLLVLNGNNLVRVSAVNSITDNRGHKHINNANPKRVMLEDI